MYDLGIPFPNLAKPPLSAALRGQILAPVQDLTA
jgi:hypothetical protein